MSFKPINVSSKFAICGLPLRLDTYKLCSFGCDYCFAENRIIGKKQEDTCNVPWLKKKFKQIFDEKTWDTTSFLEMLLKNKITLHGGAK